MLSTDATNPGPAPPVRISPSAPADAWAALCAASSRSTFFHQAGWIDLYARHHGGRALYLLAEADGRLVGGLPAVRFRRGPFHVLESLPMGTYGGPISDPGFPGVAAVEAALVTRFLELGRAPTCLRQQCVMRHVDELSRAHRFRVSPIHTVPLDGGFDRFWSDIFPKNRRNECNRAAKHGATVTLEPRPEYISAFHRLHVDAHRRWGLPPHPESFFHEVCRMDPDRVVFLTALHGSRVLGAHLCFVTGDELLAWRGVTDRQDSKTYFPSSILILAEARECIRRGLARLNVGGSGGKGGIENFKKLIGGEPDETASYERESDLLGVLRRLRRHAS